MTNIPANSFEPSHSIADALRLTGTDCLNEICRITRAQFGARAVAIGSLRVIEAEHLFIEAIDTDLEDFELHDFSTVNTPCHEVLAAKDTVAFVDNVAKQFPKAHIINKLNSRGFVGFPLFTERGDCFGIFLLEWPDAITGSLVERVKAVIAPYLVRMSEELRRVITSNSIQTMISPTGPDSLDATEVFRTVVKQAAEISGAHTVILAKNCRDEATTFKLVGAYSNGSQAPHFEGISFSYKGGPCANMVENDLHFHERGLMQQYQTIDMFREVSADSYMGIGFRDREGKTIGHIAFLHNRPMSPRCRQCELMQMICSKAGMELQRFHLETDRNAMETALRVRSKLESLGIMAGTIAHDFNNQLAAMIGNTELALLETPAAHPSMEYLKAAEESMWRARDVIGELMDFAGNNPSAELEAIALGEVVSATINEFRPQLNDVTDIRCTIQDNLPKVMGRRVHLIQVLSNLIANSLEASANEDQIDIELRASWTNRATIEHEKCLTGQCADFPEWSVMLEVLDNGRGMDGATAERIFDPYFSTKGVSRGLGLSSVLGLAKRLGIGLIFESNPNQGTAFRLYFKDFLDHTMTEPEHATNVADDALTGFNRKSILVVDDEKGIQDMVCNLLDIMGHEVHRAASGEEALTVARNIDQLDMAIIDVVMPGINGFLTLSELRKMHDGLPAVMVSGFSERNLSASFVQDDSTKFLLKPFSIKKMRDLISELVD